GTADEFTAGDPTRGAIARWLSPRQRQLLPRRRCDRLRPQPLGPLILVGEREPRGDSLIAAEKLPDKLRTVALAAAMQQHDVRRHSPQITLAAVEDLPDRGQRLL